MSRKKRRPRDGWRALGEALEGRAIYLLLRRGYPRDTVRLRDGSHRALVEQVARWLARQRTREKVREAARFLASRQPEAADQFEQSAAPASTTPTPAEAIGRS